MRIFLHDYGGYAFTLQLAKALAINGHTVCYAYSDSTQYVTRASGGDNINALTYRGIKLSKPYQKYSFIQRYLSEIEHGRLVSQEIFDFHPDVVISANTPLDAQFLILRSSRRLKARFVYWFQDAISIAIQNTLHQKLKLAGYLIGAFYQFLEGYILRSSDHVVLISQDFQELMNKWGVKQEKIQIIPNWAPPNEIMPQAKQNTWAVEHDLANQFCFLYTGILGLKHDPKFFIQLANYFCTTENVRIVIVSQGGKAEELIEKTIAMNLPNLVVLPFQPNEVYAQVLGTADVLVSILNEDAGVYSVPSKVLTYLCAGRPLLLSIPFENAASRMVIQAEAGLVSPPGNMDLFLKNANKLFKNHDLRIQMGKNARIYAEKKFDMDNILNQFETIIKQYESDS
ncbi:MAG: hypothetical protein A2X25_03255 [Chloroflexi bacterium GWB2_49_20]|nr:MAG: hypothetical protein A2X25_03255 [Chloroflexi bacterium GWB2_49_20]OGN76115.1 MAG: hypothetical protein A2X26_11530 [Chloroflexi bacterium GWC2_49_37]OGN83501.1 MAG: hypothetical protein A2X27_09365 [Chloroflexi bacterium GWD2_49_16]HBG73902.1 glycosyltransferase WbuB [Anaerolineae bacterium]HCC79519.1 glycosyltransferase WbuB [Anaerolineae bacterium]